MHSSTLDELQAELAPFLLRRRALPNDSEAIAFAERHLSGNDRLSPVEQLEIYREQFWLRHTHALVEDFPGVGGIVGQSTWEILAEGYLTAHPPSGFSLRTLGEKLPDYVAGQASLEHHRLVTDMARLEWTYVEVFDAEDPPRLAPEELARFDEDALGRARLRLHPGLRLLRLSYPVVELRKRILLRSDEPIPLPAEECRNVVVYRSELSILHESLELPAFTLLDGLSRGDTLLSACESACALGPDATARVAEKVGEWLAAWVQLKWIVGVEA
ncbi:MAG: putative DNA-binding domain-containing protein [Myxococcota bacterium]